MNILVFTDEPYPALSLLSLILHNRYTLLIQFFDSEIKFVAILTSKPFFNGILAKGLSTVGAGKVCVVEQYSSVAYSRDAMNAILGGEGMEHVRVREV